MQIHKFGGASISTAERIKNLPGIINNFESGKNLVVISALGKTTNAMENVVNLYFGGSGEAALAALEKIKQDHCSLMNELLQSQRDYCDAKLNDLFQQASYKLQSSDSSDYNYFYDQVVSFGELFSTTIVSYYLKEMNIENYFLDARDILKTNRHFREAGILWDVVSERITAEVRSLFKTHNLLITQGFIGGTLHGDSTTLGREGSDFTAAIFAYELQAEKVTIWKDVKGVMNADPKQFADAEVIPHLNYKEVIEMAYYGAQVIHPKTIKPLQNKGIPLYVRSFLHPELKGTIINGETVSALPPVIVLKKNQVLLNFQTKDFSFIEGKPTRLLNTIIAEALVKANLSQNTAISLLVCIDDIPEKTNLITGSTEEFSITSYHHLTLLTIRHYTDHIVKGLLTGKKVVLEQKTTETLQVLFEENSI